MKEKTKYDLILDALQELAHVAVQPTGMFAPTGGQKRALSESVLLKSLEE